MNTALPNCPACTQESGCIGSCMCSSHDEPDATTFGPDAWVVVLLLAISLALIVGGWHVLWAAL